MKEKKYLVKSSVTTSFKAEVTAGSKEEAYRVADTQIRRDLEDRVQKVVVDKNYKEASTTIMTLKSGVDLIK